MRPKLNEIKVRLEMNNIKVQEMPTYLITIEPVSVISFDRNKFTISYKNTYKLYSTISDVVGRIKWLKDFERKTFAG